MCQKSNKLAEFRFWREIFPRVSLRNEETALRVCDINRNSSSLRADQPSPPFVIVHRVIYIRIHSNTYKSYIYYVKRIIFTELDR